MSMPIVTAWVLGLWACAGISEDTSAEGPTSGELTVLTYNVHGLPSLITGDDTPGRMGMIGPMLDNIPLVAIQEDFTEQGHAELMDAVTHPTRPWFDATLSGRFYGSGLTILSRAEQMEYTEQHYSSCNGLLDNANDCLASKGFQRARLRLGPDAHIDVYNTHLDAGNDAADDEARTVQVQELLLAIADASTDQAVLVMGDFNLSGSDPEDALLVEELISVAGLQDICDALDCEEPGRIDRILFRSGTELQLEALEWTVDHQFVDSSGAMLSDHNAIGGRLRWARKELE